MDPSPIHAQVQQLISRALTGIPPLPASHDALANPQPNDPNRVPLKPLPQALANAGNPNACKICHVDILGGPKFRICLSCGAPSHLYPATRSSLDAALSTERSSRQSAGSGDARSSDVSRGSSVSGSLPGTSVSGTSNSSNDKSGLWRNTRIERRYLMSLEFKPQDDKPSERTLAETLAGINAPPPDATSTRGSTAARGSTGSAGRTSNASGVTSARGSTGAPPSGATSTRGSTSSTASSGGAAGAAGTGGKSGAGGVGAAAATAGVGAGVDAATAAAATPAAAAAPAAAAPPVPSQAPDFIPDDFFAAPSTVSSTSTPAAVSSTPAALPSAFSSALPTPLPAPGALPASAATSALAATSASPAAVPAIPSASGATGAAAAAPSSFFAASFGSAGVQQQQQQQGAATIAPERHSSGSSALDFFSQLSGITSSVLSGTASSSSSAHPSGATHTNDPAAGMSAFAGNFAGSFPGSQPYTSHDGQFGQFAKPEPANPVVQEILQSLPDLSFMLADHLVVPGRDPGGLREFNSRPKVSAASIIASCVPPRAVAHAATVPTAGGAGAEAGAAAAPAAAAIVDSAEGATTSALVGKRAKSSRCQQLDLILWKILQRQVMLRSQHLMQTWHQLLLKLLVLQQLGVALGWFHKWERLLCLP
ncbi:unnamed protein product [Closterium sp. Naga37s-1]|nr:unnamed protein product [Closterium sp. Naga37s-1]